jgi:hypothetical protein
MTVADRWDAAPTGRLLFRRGAFHPSGKAIAFDEEDDLDLEDALAMFGDTLPARPNSWSWIVDGERQSVIGYAWKEGQLHWVGCKVAFDALAEMRPSERTDIVFWAILAEHTELQDVET